MSDSSILSIVSTHPPRTNLGEKSSILASRQLIHRLLREGLRTAVPKSNSEIAHEIRKQFTISFLDPNAVRILVSSNQAVISGLIQRLPGYESPILPQTMIRLEVDLTNIQQVKFIRWVLDNWSNEAGQWREIKEKQERF